MIKHLLLLYSILFFTECSLPKKQQQPAYPVEKKQYCILSFGDTLLINGFPTLKGVKTILQPESKIKSVHFEDSLISIHIGLIDFNGDGIFNDPSVDLFAATVGQNRQIRINADNGTPHCKTRDSIYIQVDSLTYLISAIEASGSKAQFSKSLSSNKAPKKADLFLKTYIKGWAFNKYAGGQIFIDSIIHSKDFTYIYFWNTDKLDYQLKKVEKLFNKHDIKVNIIGVHCKDHELDKSTQDTFFDLLAKPWNGYYCTTSQYEALNQDYSWYRGLLIQKDGKIIFPHISPKELEAWLNKI